MPTPRVRRAFAPALLASVLLCGASGCPELNYWEGPSENSLFSVDDYPPEAADRPAEDSWVPAPKAE
jgi:hypothetical protein